jgi:hypothetical protein
LPREETYDEHGTTRCHLLASLLADGGDVLYARVRGNGSEIYATCGDRRRKAIISLRIAII